ncbi:mRNA-binding ubiquitin-specific protease UBP3 KNAG_0G01670 [Huiozyma naganishii CBS 8797]|uniref:ubiquitinyl hydrolase 1 n=1 Tax=Huiozyma naganishii (strain ATCC MYA-139 / BCRC 22969 / CBS 8797 / KCTC 17520 / NBRC 10181 / NCYC 3082 / Yp74L-3) TaxID=1071383 RepID=J7R8M8_HUIN7|nr:hypothetical protein KNAG_0G01670 [Kazachstania naganishii CBS 8797]CCK71225.1 hypothetical protein KNAG_0G01670 [Kazachstania naganishii CBS 8797]
MNDNMEESYSMYPATSSTQPPPQGNMRMPIYQNPIPMYGYPQSPYIYATQTPNYHYKMMNSNQSIPYQGNAGIPHQNHANGGMKKKWNSNNNTGNYLGGTGSTAMNPAKSQPYYPNQNYYSNHLAMNAGQNVSGSNSNKTSTPTVSYDPYKFDVSKTKAKMSTDINKCFPLFINTDAKEFAEARAKTHNIRLEKAKTVQYITVPSTKTEENKQASNDVSIEKSVKTSKTEGTTEPKPAEVEKPTPKITTSDKTKKTADVTVDDVQSLPTVKKSPKEETPKHLKAVEDGQTQPPKVSTLKKDDEKKKAKASSVNSTPESPVSVTPTETPASADAPLSGTSSASVSTMNKTPARSWSAVASSSVPKGKPVTLSSHKSLHSRTSSQTPPAVHLPQKKDKKYVPPSTKGSEPLGALALRMCFDPDYVNYFLSKSIDMRTNLPVKSIIPRGIVNTANICFMSSVLQVLLHCKPFVDILNVLSTRNPNSKTGAMSCKLTDALTTLYSEFDRENFEEEKREIEAKTKPAVPTGGKIPYAAVSDAIKPDSFYMILSKIPKFKDLQWGHQEDAEEFLTHLLDQLEEELLAAIECLSENEIQNILQSINDENLKIFFIRNLARYKNADFMKNISFSLKSLIERYGTINDDENDENDGDGWHEVSSTSKKGKKTKMAAKRTVEVVPSPISSLFGGQFRSVLDIPNNKESQSITLDPFQTIQLDISDEEVNDLESAFKKFSEFEFLPFKGSNGQDVQAKKQTFIDKLPQVLLIQLKRFSFVNNTEQDKTMANYNSYNGRIEKIRKRIDYQHQLTIPVESVSQHLGKGKESGETLRIDRCDIPPRCELERRALHRGRFPQGGEHMVQNRRCGHYEAGLCRCVSGRRKWDRFPDSIHPHVPKNRVNAGGGR